MIFFSIKFNETELKCYQFVSMLCNNYIMVKFKKNIQKCILYINCNV
jgi:hypothetical protein